MKYILLVFVLATASCIKDSVTLSNTIFTNTTSHQINVSGYSNGIIQAECSFRLNPNESKSVFTLNNRGIGNGLPFGGYFRNMDSFLVSFNDLYFIAHYKPNLIGNSLKNYQFSSNRNIFNDTNYIKSITKDEKHRRELNFEYTFIEQDYLDAK